MLATDDTPQAAGRGFPATIFVALELSRKGWLVAIGRPSRATASHHRIRSGDLPSLLDLLERVRASEGELVGQPCRILSVYEAGYDGFWLHRRLVTAGIESQVLDPSSLRIDRRARRAKTDRLDVESLLRALIQWRQGDRHACRLVRVPSIADEDAKRLHRERRELIRERIRHVNRIKGLLVTHGIYDFEPLTPAAEQELLCLRTAEGHQLPGGMMRALQRELERLVLVVRQISAAEAERQERLATSNNPVGATMRQLAQLRAIGPEIATVLTTEVFYRKFNNRREVAAYSGLTPSPFASGNVQRDQGISKAGNAIARTTMIELAWLWLRHQPQSVLANWFRAKVGTNRGRIRRIAVVALARKLLIALWRYVTTGAVPPGAMMKA